MKTRSFYPVLLALFAIGSVLCQNTEKLLIPVEADNQFPPERSESEGNSEGTESTAAEPTQLTPESTTTGVAISALAEEDEHVIDAGDEITAGEPAETTFGSTIVIDDESVDSAAKLSEPTSESTIEDLTASAMTNDGEQDTKIGDSETTAIEPNQTTPESTIVEEFVPELTNDEHVTKNEDIETTAVEPTQTTGSTIVDITAPISTTNDEQETTYKDSETTSTQATEATSGSATPAVGPPVLANDDEHVANNEDSETTTAESIHILSGSTISNADQDQVTNNETMVVEPTDSTPESSMDAGLTCPEPCTCITEGDATNYIVDCSGHGLTDLPESIDPKTTSLKLQNNQLIVIPKRISELKNLKNLNANDNLITELESGSVSELTELVSLKLANNRFQEYPKDLENALNLDKLEELDLAGNELKTTPDIFLNLKALRTVTLLEASSELVSQLCSFKETLEKVCTESCSEHSFECKDVSAHDKENSLDATLPGMIPFFHEIVKEETTTGSKIPSTPGAKEISDTSAELSVPDNSANSRRKESSEMSPNANEMPSSTNNNLPVNEFSLRTAVINAPQEKVALQSIVIDNPKESPNNETDVKVGAKTTETKGGGGVDKSVIAVIVAGMVVIVAVIAIKKNWSSIRKRFSSTPRANDRSDRNTNGTTVTPEEVPLQDKSPV